MSCCRRCLRQPELPIELKSSCTKVLRPSKETGSRARTCTATDPS